MKKLSLKRKLPQDKLEVKDSRFNSNIEEATATKSVKTNPEIEADDVIIVEQRTSVSSEICEENKTSSFLECEDPSLNRLRQMILNLAPKDMNISPFPSINSDYSDSDIETGRCKVVEGGQPISSDIQHNVAELTPFPKVCPHFIKPKEKRRESCGTSNRLPDKSHKHSENSVHNKNIVNQCNSNTIGKTSATSSMYRDNNCHLLRDRNSNLYACQSQNTANINKDLQKCEDDKQCQNKRKLSQQNTSHNTVSNEQTQSGSRSMKDDTRSDRDQLLNSVPHDVVTLKCCPLCQKQFTKRENQLDIDAHIAGCLSASDDSVTW